MAGALPIGAIGVSAWPRCTMVAADKGSMQGGSEQMVVDGAGATKDVDSLTCNVRALGHAGEMGGAHSRHPQVDGAHAVAHWRNRFSHWRTCCRAFK